MDKAQFWRLIEDAKAEADGDCDEQVELIQRALMRLPPEEITAFDETLDELRDAAFRYDLWGAGCLINGGCSNDGFEYFRCWLIARGQAVFKNALKDADSLADYVEPDFDGAECEPLPYVAGHAYEKKTGQEMPSLQVTAGEAPEPGKPWAFVAPVPAGRKWEHEDELDALLPRLSAKIASSEPG